MIKPVRRMFGPCEIKRDTAELSSEQHGMLQADRCCHLRVTVTRQGRSCQPQCRPMYPPLITWSSHLPEKDILVSVTGKNLSEANAVCSNSTEVTSTMFWSCKHSFYNYSFRGHTERLVFSMYFTKAQTNACCCLERGCMWKKCTVGTSVAESSAHIHFIQKRPGNTFFLEINVASRTRDTCRKM